MIIENFRHLLISVLALVPLGVVPSSVGVLDWFDSDGARRSGWSSDAPIDRKIDSLLSIMTLEEKLGQLNQLSAAWDRETGAAVSVEQLELVKKGRVGSFLNVIGAETTRKVQQIAVEESRLGIPLLFGFDVIHGFRTIFPIPLAEASTWDPDAVEEAARVGAVEASAAGIHWTFAPMVDIARDPRWGRIAEGSGEDPYLGSVMAAARVKGFQGEDLTNSSSLLACAKHFAAYGAAEAGRDYNTVDVSERTLREIYLPPFKAAVKAGVGSIMCSFNEIAGIPSSANRMLLKGILRQEWAFDGFVVSDWTSIAELQRHGVAGTRAEAGLLAIQAGVDVDMQSRIYENELGALVRSGGLSEEVVNDAVRRVLRAKFKLGLFNDPYRNSNPELEKKVILSKHHLDTALKVSEEAIVLLKNENGLLPLSKHERTVAVLGSLAEDSSAPLGPWGAAGNPSDVVTVLEGIKSKVSSDSKVLYAKGCDVSGNSSLGFAEARELAARADVTIVVIGEDASMSGEASSRSSLHLPGVQEDFLKAIVETGTPVVVVLMNGRPLSISWAAEHVPAILETWFLGVQTGRAIADVLFGDVNPSGKLPVSIPRSVGQVPIYYNHKNTGRPASEEKFTSKYLDSPTTPLYPFGYGLSYTKFTYSGLQLSANKIRRHETLRIFVEVSNAGSRKGDEVVQLYVQDQYASVTRPVKELKAFRRISLEPGETRKVEFTLSTDQLAFYDAEMNLVIEPGSFKVFVGTSSVDLLEEEFEILAQ